MLAVLGKQVVSHTTFLFIWPFASHLFLGWPWKQTENPLVQFSARIKHPTRPRAGQEGCDCFSRTALAAVLLLVVPFWFGSILHPFDPYLVPLTKRKTVEFWNFEGNGFVAILLIKRRWDRGTNGSDCKSCCRSQTTKVYLQLKHVLAIKTCLLSLGDLSLLPHQLHVALRGRIQRFCPEGNIKKCGTFWISCLAKQNVLTCQ